MILSGPWNPSRVARYLDETVIPVRLACRAPSGWPLVLSLWHLHRDGALWCATSARAHIVRCLEGDPRCAFEVARDTPPYLGVRGRGRVELLPERGREILGALIDRYLGDRGTPLARWLLGRADDEVALRIEPLRLTSWDYTRRMGPA
jgi:hypothetical protein